CKKSKVFIGNSKIYFWDKKRRSLEYIYKRAVLKKTALLYMYQGYNKN
ncbi:MAG: hypothetical protein K0R90_631, partial [Oscillospiraceae bacterium]|nr:hypothetical protein [Oscillospiraceae bacterium]